MKRTLNMGTARGQRVISVTIGLCMGGLLLFTGGCEKADQPKALNESAHSLNEQEKLLVGRWDLKQKETYEVAGVDSMGQCQCNLLSISAGDSTCLITFFNSVMGAGAIGGCDANAGFTWGVPQLNKLQTNNGLFQVEYLSKDSMVISNVYVKDILELKDVFRYHKK